MYDFIHMITKMHILAIYQSTGQMPVIKISQTSLWMLKSNKLSTSEQLTYAGGRR